MKNGILFFVLMFIISFSVISQEKIPLWVNSTSSSYSEKDYLVALGEGSLRSEADNKAFSNLAKIFGMDVTVNSDASSLISNSTSDRNNNYTTNFLIEEVSITSSHFIENMYIAEFWQHPETKRWYSLAVLPKEKSMKSFKEGINELNTVIETYLNNAETETDLLRKFTLFDLASQYAKECETLYVYYNVLASQYKQSLYNYHEIKTIADLTVKGITVKIEPLSENSLTHNIIKKMLSNFGMKINRDSDYVIRENLSYTVSDTPYGIWIINYVFTIELIDSSENIITAFIYEGTEGGESEDVALRNLNQSLAKYLEDGNPSHKIESLYVQFNNFLFGNIE